jgi:hypothetical protein
MIYCIHGYSGENNELCRPLLKYNLKRKKRKNNMEIKYDGRNERVRQRIQRNENKCKT